MKKFQARKTIVRWHMTFSMKIQYPTFWRVERLFKPCNKHSYLSSAFSWHVFLLLIKKAFTFLISTAGSIQKFYTYNDYIFFNLKKPLTFWVKLLKLKRYLDNVWRCHFKKKNLIELFSFKKKIKSNGSYWNRVLKRQWS